MDDSSEHERKLWYTLERSLPEQYQQNFLPLMAPDAGTIDWLNNAKQLSTNIWLNIWHYFARLFLQFFMSQTNINGLLNRGSMYILSEAQFELLLRKSGAPSYSLDKITILDIGAGDGEISECLRRSFQCIHPHAHIKMFATETSVFMQKRLLKRGIRVLDNIKNMQNVQLISCLNVLDRCIDPFEMLEEIYNTVAPDGRVVLALVLPYVHYVEFNTSHLPKQPLMDHWPARSKQFNFEMEATRFFNLLENRGFKVESWTKAPYLCQGDFHQSFYWLVDLVVVLSKK